MTDLPHPSWNQLVDFAEGRLDAPTTSQLSAHVRECGRCRPQVAWLRGTMRGFSEDGFRAPPREAREAVMAAWDRRNGSDVTTTVRPVVLPSVAPRRVVRPRVSWSVVALAAALVLALLFLWRSQPQTIVASVQDVRGGVEITQVGGASQPAANAQTLAAGDQVATWDDGQARLEFGNGTAAVTVLSSSEVRVEQIALQGQTLERVVVRLLRGEVETAVANSGALTLLVSDATLTTQDGTFRARLLEDAAVAVEVVSGQLSAGNGEGSVILESGESLILYPGTAPGVLPPSQATLVPTQTATTTATLEPTQIATASATVTRAATRTVGPSTTAPVLAPQAEFIGRIENIPTGRVGQWRVGGRAFISTASTELREDDGALIVGACVEVRFADDGRAIRIRTQEARECDEGDDEGQHNNSGSGSDDGAANNSGGDDTNGASDDDGSTDDSGGDDSGTDTSSDDNSGDDDSGPGSGSDDGAADDSGGDDSGSTDEDGSAEDSSGRDDSANDNSGPGSGSDDGVDNTSGDDDSGSDNSEPGSASDDPTDDTSDSSGGDNSGNSGSGSDDDGSDSDDSGGDNSGSGSDEGGDNSGSGNDNNGGDDDSDSGDEGDNSSGDDGDNSGSGNGDEEDGN